MNNRTAWMGLRVAGAALALVPVASAAQWGAPELVGSGSPSRLILSPDGAHRAVTEGYAPLEGPPARRVGGIWERAVLPANAQFGSRVNARGDVLALGRTGPTTDDVSATLIATGGATSSQTLAPRPDTTNGLFANPLLAGGHRRRRVGHRRLVTQPAPVHRCPCADTAGGRGAGRRGVGSTQRPRSAAERRIQLLTDCGNP